MEICYSTSDSTSSALDQSAYEQLVESACPGKGTRLAAAFPGPRQLIAASLTELERAGLDQVEALRLISSFELTRAARRSEAPTRIHSVDAAAMVVMPHLIDSICERVIAIALDKRNSVITPFLVAEGGLDRAHIDPRILFGRLIRVGAAATIVGHSHPSGDPTPSRADVVTTERLIDAGSLLEIEIVDHLVIAGDRWCSMREEGLI